MIKQKQPRQYLHNMDQKGSFIGAALIIIIVLTAIGLSLAEVITAQYAHTKRNVYVANALLVAEAGIEESIQELNTDNDFAGFTTPQEFFNNSNQGRGVYTSTIEDVASGSSKIITSEAKIYNQNNPNTPISTKKIKVTIVGTESDGYSVQTGPGGLILTGSANITNSDVYVNGTISLSGAAKIGTHNQPLNVSAANMSCPPGAAPGASYAQVCGAGSQPITMAHSTRIYGTVCATGQTSTGPNNNILPGLTGQGLVAGCVAPPISQPSFDRDAHIASMTTTASGTSNTYTCQSWPFDRTWPANLRLNGNVTVGGSCNITLNGNAYISGDLNINGASRITVNNSVGTTRPVVLVDGKITVNGSGQLNSNSSGTGIYFISTKSNASCASACTNLTGNELKTTQGYETINVGGGVNLAGMVFQAYWGKVKLGGSGNVGAAVGQTVDMSGAGTVTFGTKLSSGDKIWTVTSYQQVFD